MTEAVAAANEAGAPEWLLASAGPVKGGWAVVVGRHEMSPSNPQDWLTALTTVLEARQVAGKLVAVGRRGLGHDREQDWRQAQDQSRLYPALYVSHPPTRGLTDPNAPSGWLGSPEATRVRSEDAIFQCFTPAGPSEQVDGGVHTISSAVTPVPGSGPAILAAVASVAKSAGVLTWSDNLASRRAKLLPGGEYLLSIADARRGTLEIVDQLRASLIASPELANYGFIRTSHWGTIMLHEFLRPETGHVRPQEKGIVGPENPWANSARWQQNCHLHDTYALDAHALNLMTGKHLDRANDLSNWSITEVGDDRYLVEARDLRPWFDGKPDLQVLEQARQDFGDMLITWNVVLERPGPQTAYPPHLPRPKL